MLSFIRHIMNRFGNLCFLLGFFLCATFYSFSQTTRSSILKLKCGPLAMEVDTSIGGRIISFSYKNKNLLISSAENPDYYGSTFWPAPQHVWHWPPPHNIERGPYHIIQSSDTCVNIRSLHDPIIGITVQKKFTPSFKDTSIYINYTIINTGAKSVMLAPWEVTRVNAKGMVFFPSKTPNFWTAKKSSNALFRYDQEHFWLFLNNSPKKGYNKFFCDGAGGWMAFVNDSLLFIKKFPDIEAKLAAPKESEIELFLNFKQRYMEIEQQGAYEFLAPGDSLSWKVKWYLRSFTKNENLNLSAPDKIWPHSIEHILGK